MNTALGKFFTQGPDIATHGAANPEALKEVAAGKSPEHVQLEGQPLTPGPDPEAPWNKPFAQFRQGLENMSGDMHKFADTHASQLNPGARALLHGVAGLMEQAPVGENALQTAAMLPLWEKPEEEGALGKGKPKDFSEIPGHKEVSLSKKEAPAPKLGPGKDFYSPLEHTIETKLPDKMTGEQLLNTLSNSPGVSKAELEHAGLQDLATEPKHVNKLKESLSKEEVLAHVRERTPHVETIQKIDSENSTTEYNAINDKAAEAHEKLKASLRTELGLTDQQASNVLADHFSDNPSLNPVRRAGGTGQSWFDFRTKHFDELNDYGALKAKVDELEDHQGEEGTKYGQYTLPGGKNYREVLLTLPAKDSRFTDPKADPFDRRAARVESAEDYSGPHFDEPNVVAHLRLKDRTDANGKKTLFIEELQSDWAKELREQKENDATGRFPSEEAAQRREEGGVPPMPFDKSWHELALKKALDIAAKEGYDQVAWTTGAQQADRYNLRNYFGNLTLREEDGKLTLLAREANSPETSPFHVKTFPVDRENLAQYVGKDQAKELLDKLDKEQVKPDINHETGEFFDNFREASTDLTKNPVAMGGEHHLRLYDEMVPQFMSRYTKKWGGKVGETEIEVPNKTAPSGSITGEERAQGKFGKSNVKVQALPITPEMRDTIKRGQPLFGGGNLDFSSISGHKQHTEP
ncbi:MAG: hypothetical protein ACYDHE_11355, partial [Candidatus Acidiferrales bacterium]